MKKGIVINIFIKTILFSIFIFWWSFSFSFATSCVSKKGKISNLEINQIVSACDKEIGLLSKEIIKKRKEGLDISKDIGKIELAVSVLEKELKLKKDNLKKLEEDISRNKERILALNKKEEKIILQIRQLLIRKNKADNIGFIEIIFGNGSIGDFMNHLRVITILEKEITKEVAVIKSQKDEVIKINQKLNGVRGEDSGLIAQAEEDRRRYAEIISRKEEYLASIIISKNDYSRELRGKKNIKAGLLSRKYKLSSGQSITFGEAYNILKTYQKSFQMDEAFVLAILFQESSGSVGGQTRIGANIGSCYYNQKNVHGGEKNGYQVMAKSQQKNFLKIMRGIGKSSSKQKISCPIPADGSYGGAMGPAQFMPNTWMEVNQTLARYTGISKNKVSPFKSGNAILASAIFLNRNYYSKTCSSYVAKNLHQAKEKELRERCAAAKYYAGSNWKKHKFGYAQDVINKANRFRKDIILIEK